jgi:hypothetical protein
MINNPYLVCWIRCFLSLIIPVQALCPPPPPSPHPLSYNSLPCMWSFCMSSFPTDAIFFSLDLTDSCIPHHQPPFSFPPPGPYHHPHSVLPPPLPPPSPLPSLSLISSPPSPSAPLPFSYLLPSPPFLPSICLFLFCFCRQFNLDVDLLN